jgi:hypothetical protein
VQSSGTLSLVVCKVCKVQGCKFRQCHFQGREVQGRIYEGRNIMVAVSRGEKLFRMARRGGCLAGACICHYHGGFTKGERTSSLLYIVVVQFHAWSFSSD